MRIKRLSDSAIKQLAHDVEDAIFDEQITKRRAGVKEYQHRVTQLFTCLGDADNHVLESTLLRLHVLDNYIVLSVENTNSLDVHLSNLTAVLVNIQHYSARISLLILYIFVTRSYSLISLHYTLYGTRICNLFAVNLHNCASVCV